MNNDVLNTQQIINKIIENESIIQNKKIELIKCWIDQGKRIIELRESMSIEEIAKKASVSKSTLYNYKTLAESDKVNKLFSNALEEKAITKEALEPFNQTQLVKIAGFDAHDFRESLLKGRPVTDKDKQDDVVPTLEEKLSGVQNHIEQLQKKEVALIEELADTDDDATSTSTTTKDDAIKVEVIADAVIDDDDTASSSSTSKDNSIDVEVLAYTVKETIAKKEHLIQQLKDEIKVLQINNKLDVDDMFEVPKLIVKAKPTFKPKSINQIDLKSGEIIKTFESLGDAAQQTGFSKSSLSKCCTGVQKKANGFKWRYRDA